MPITDYNAEETIVLDPAITRCICKKSVLLPALPWVHCVSCHKTYRARNLRRPRYCAGCGFNMYAWRARNGIEEVTPPLP